MFETPNGLPSQFDRLLGLPTHPTDIMVGLAWEKLKWYESHRHKKTRRHRLARQAFYTKLSDILGIKRFGVVRLVRKGSILTARFLDVYTDEVCMELDKLFGKQNGYFTRFRDRYISKLKLNDLWQEPKE